MSKYTTPFTTLPVMGLACPAYLFQHSVNFGLNKLARRDYLADGISSQGRGTGMKSFAISLFAASLLIGAISVFGALGARAQEPQGQTFSGMCSGNLAEAAASPTYRNNLKLDRFPQLNSTRIAASCKCLTNLKNAQGEAAPYIEDTAIQHKFSRGLFNWRRAKPGLFGMTYNTRWSEGPHPYSPGSEPVWVRVAYGKFADGMGSCAPTGWDPNIFLLSLARDFGSTWVVSSCKCGDCSSGCPE